MNLGWMQAVVCGTLNAAREIGITNLGAVAPGFAADLQIVPALACPRQGAPLLGGHRSGPPAILAQPFCWLAEDSILGAKASTSSWLQSSGRAIFRLSQSVHNKYFSGSASRSTEVAEEPVDVSTYPAPSFRSASSSSQDGRLSRSSTCAQISSGEILYSP